MSTLSEGAMKYFLIELKGKTYYYDPKGDAFFSKENLKRPISFTELQTNWHLREELGYTDDLLGLKKNVSYLLIQSHAMYGICPSKEDIEIMDTVFPRVAILSH